MREASIKFENSGLELHKMPNPDYPERPPQPQPEPDEPPVLPPDHPGLPPNDDTPAPIIEPRPDRVPRRVS